MAGFSDNGCSEFTNEYSDISPLYFTYSPTSPQQQRISLAQKKDDTDTSLSLNLYLTNRKQFVCVNGHCFEIFNITRGVPQGSALFFLLYTNDLPNISKKLKFYLFADDKNLYFSSNNLDYLQTVVNIIKSFKKFQNGLELTD